MAQKKTSPSLISSAALEGSALDLRQQELFGQSHSVSKTPSAKLFCESIGPKSRSTMMSEPSTLKATSTSSQGAIHASPSPLPGSKKAQRMTATSGRRCFKLLSTKDPAGSWLKTLLVTSQWASTKCCLTWKAKATPRGRLLFQLAPSMPRTDEIASGLWPTPHANCHTGAGSHGDGGDNIQTVVRMWPTPTTRDHKGANSDKHLAKARGHHDQLPNAVKMAGHKDGQLNPTWVEWLMGFPTGWTDLKPWEMPSSRKSSRKSDAQSSKRRATDAQ